MHAHHKNLHRDFWLISPGKTPTGKTSQRGEILLFFSKIKWTEIQEKYNLSPPRIYPKVWTLSSAKRTQPYTSISEPINLQTVPLKKNRTSSNKCAVHLDFCAVINAVHTALNAACTVHKNLNFRAGNMPRNSS